MKQVSHSESAIIHVDHEEIDGGVIKEEGRAFRYTLNQKKAKAKLLKGAKRNNLNVEIRPGCVNLRFNGGAYFQIVLPLLREWKMKCNETVNINEVKAKIVEVDAGMENSLKHVDTKLTLMVNDDRYVLHAYNGTQNLMVQGRNYENFAVNYLEPFFTEKIKSEGETIAKFNDNVKDALGGAKPLKKTYNCPQCDIKSSTNSDHKLHMKTCHTKPGLNSPHKSKIIRVNNEDNTISNKIEIKAIKMMEIGTEKEDLPKICSQNLLPQLPIVEDLQSCYNCDFDTESVSDLNKHMQIVHGNEENIENITDEEPPNTIDTVQIIEENKSIDNLLTCETCSLSFKRELEFNNHLTSHETPHIFQCEKCQNTFHSDLDFEWHKETSHNEETVAYKCKKCDFIGQTQKDLNTHIQSIHMLTMVNIGTTDQIILACDICEYKCKLNIQLKRHMKIKHTEEPNHTYKEYIKDEMETMRKELKEAFETFADLVGEVISAHKDDTNEKLGTLADAVHKFGAKIVKTETRSKQANGKMKVLEKPVIKANATKDIRKLNSATPAGPPPVIPSPPTPPAPSAPTPMPWSSSPRPGRPSQSRKSTKFLRKFKTLYVTDSVGSSVSLREIELEQGCRIKTARAYTSVHNSMAKWPKLNFTDVVNDSLKNPGREDIEVLVMSAPTVDVTNQNTHIEQTASNKNRLENEVRLSSNNMFSLAETALSETPNLEKVILMEHPPRFDLPDVDPHAVKPNLAKLANITLGQYWLNSPLKDKIIIGRHNLDSPGVGATHYRRYQSKLTGRYDGVHLYGQTGLTDYTRSVNNILALALHTQKQYYAASELGQNKSENHTNCPQAIYQRKKYHESVQISNRFDVLNQGNF